MSFGALRNGTLIVTAVVYGVLETASGYLAFVGWIIGVLIVLSLWRYAYDVLRHFAQGRTEIPAPDLDSIIPFGRWALFMHLIAFPGTIAFARIYLPAWPVFTALIVAVFPASAALMAVTGRLESAFSPAGIWQCIRTLGRDYVWLAGSCLLVAAAVILVVRLVGGSASVMAIAGSEIVGIWGLLAVFGLIGEALHAHRLEFDIPGERADPAETALADRERAWGAVLDQAYASLRGGRPDAGYRALRQFLEAEGNSAQAHYWLVEHLFDWDDKRHALGVAGRLISAEIADGRSAQALDLFRRCRRVSAGFALPAPDAAALAAYAGSIGQQGLASELAALAPPADGPASE